MFCSDLSLHLAKMANLYESLSNEPLYQHMFKHKDEHTAIIEVQLPTLHCSSCVKAVETLPNIAPGIISVRVNFSQKLAQIKYQRNKWSLQQVIEKVDDMGYPPDISLASANHITQSPVNHRRRASIDLGVAGFAFGNTMLFAFPEYMGLDGDSGIANLLTWLTVLLSLPVLLFSARSFFKTAWSGIKQWKGNMDIPITLGIIAIAASSYWEFFTQSGPGYFDSLAGLVFFLLIGRWFQNNTYARLDFERDYQSFFPFSALRVNGDEEVYVKLTAIETGDLLKVRHGELIPTDGIITAGRSHVDMQFITGESEPLPVVVDGEVYAGSKLTGPAITFRVTKQLDQSYLTTLWAEDPRKKKPKASHWIDRLGTVFTGFVLTLSAATALIWAMIDPSQILWVVSSVLIVACPCALALSIPFGLGHTVRHLNAFGAFVKSTQTIERLASINAWVFDKTGTLTDSQTLTWTEEPVVTAEDQNALRLLTGNSAHPLSRSLTSHWQNSGDDALLSHFNEVIGKGVEATISGHSYALGQPQWLNAPAGEYHRAVAWQKDGEFGGWLIPRSSYRPGLKSSMEDLDHVALLTGDNDAEQSNLEALLPKGTDMRFRQSPHEKLSFVQGWQAEGKQVAMVGDGLNDAGALAVSDVGISIADDAFHFAPACDILLQGDKLPDLPAIQAMAKSGMQVVRANIGLSLAYNAIGLTFAVQGLLTPIVAAILMPVSSLSVVALSFVLTQRAKAKHLPS